MQNLKHQKIFTSDFNPRAQPIIQLPQSDILLPQSLSLDFIQYAFANHHEWQVEPIFAKSFPSDFSSYFNYKPAAVFVPLVQRDSGLSMLFTKRSKHLQNHAGQICFPGGRAEEKDKDEIETALREMQEEIGVHPKYIDLIGTHPSFVTVSQFIMKPVIGYLKPGFNIIPDTNEVEQVFEVPLSILMDPTQHRLHSLPMKIGNERFYFSITWQQHFIWGATAILIRNLYRFLHSAQNALKP